MKEIEELYMLYKEDIYRYLLSLTRDPNLSEDLLSETFVNAIKSIRNFKGQSSIKTWLFSIARNLWLQSIRGKRNLVEYNDLLGLYVGIGMDEKLITGEKLERIKSLLKEKDGRTQRIVSMRVEGYSFREIAIELGIKENSARVIDYRAKAWLRDILDKEGLN